MSLSLRQIEVFRAIMVCGTFTDAARMLNISQPAVSRVVGHAESRLGFKLFRRARGSLSPTLEARALYPDVERIFRELAALQRFAGDLGAGRTGLLRVAASSALGFSVLPNAINAFRADWPGVKVVSHWLPATQMADLVLAHEIDLGLTVAPVQAPTARSEVLAATEMVCVMPEGHALAARDAVEPEDLAPHPLVSYGKGSHYGRLIEEAFASRGLMPRVEVEVAVTLIAMPLVQGGAGVALVDGLIARQFTDGLTWRPFRPAIPLYVHLLTSSASPASSFKEPFLGYVQRVLGDTIDSPSPGSDRPRGNPTPAIVRPADHVSRATGTNRG